MYNKPNDIVMNASNQLSADHKIVNYTIDNPKKKKLN